MTDLSELDRASVSQTNVTAEVVEKADALLDSAMIQVFALDDFARRYGDAPFGHNSMRTAILALSEVARSALGDAWDLLPGHQARSLITKAIEQTEAVDEVVSGCGDADGITIPSRSLSDALFAIVVRLGQSIELASAACSGGVDNYYLLHAGRADPNRVGDKPVASPAAEAHGEEMLDATAPDDSARASDTTPEEIAEFAFKALVPDGSPIDFSMAISTLIRAYPEVANDGLRATASVRAFAQALSQKIEAAMAEARAIDYTTVDGTEPHPLVDDESVEDSLDSLTAYAMFLTDVAARSTSGTPTGQLAHGYYLANRILQDGLRRLSAVQASA